MTLPPTARHVFANGDEVEHINVHNAYGAMMTKATYDALIGRDGGKHRPFILTRSSFLGTQQYGAMWTGDNQSTYQEARSIVH
jgi:alpha 1,3-glucosidase